MSGFSQTCPLFQVNLCLGGFLSFQKFPGFWPLLIVTLNFSVFVMYIIVRRSHRPCFNFRTYFTQVW
jgi:hypothetical protein